MISNYKEVLFDYEQLETKNLILRKFKKSDVEDVYEYGSDEETVKYLVWDAFKNIDDAKASIINKGIFHDVAHYGITKEILISNCSK